jgi:hypothetical protein
MPDVLLFSCVQDAHGQAVAILPLDVVSRLQCFTINSHFITIYIRSCTFNIKTRHAVYYDVTLSCVCVTIVAVEKQQVFYIPSVYL